MNKLLTRFLSISVLLATVLILAPRADAQLRQIDQTVFGMDCAPCAHAMEQSLGRLEGVENVSVSLNSGLAKLDLSPTNDVTYDKVRSIVSNGGFKADTATLTLTGTVRQEAGQWILRTPTGEAYVLSGLSGGNESLSGDGAVQVRGRIEADQARTETGWRLAVQQVSDLANSS